MIIIAGTIDLDPDALDTAWAAIVPMMAASRAEAGCHEYVFSLDHETPGRLRLYELWEDEPALEAHQQSAHMATYRAAMESVPTTGRDIRLFHATAK